MLPESYKQALLGLQGQARAAAVMLTDKAAGKAALADAQRLMVKHDAECKRIVRLVMASEDGLLTIPTLTEKRLAELLVRGGWQ